jgi:hypothetical protein
MIAIYPVWIRLGCLYCDRSDYDGITDLELELLKETWEDIGEFNASLVADWETHMGVCPECRRLFQ